MPRTLIWLSSHLALHFRFVIRKYCPKWCIRQYEQEWNLWKKQPSNIFSSFRWNLATTRAIKPAKVTNGKKTQKCEINLTQTGTTCERALKEEGFGALVITYRKDFSVWNYFSVFILHMKIRYTYRNILNIYHCMNISIVNDL